MASPSDILILGGSGFIGSALADYLAGAHKVVAIGSAEGDLSDAETVRAIVTQHVGPETTIIFAVAKVRRDGDTQDAADQNITFAVNLRRALEGASFRQLVVFSSFDVFGQQREAISAQSPLHPSTLYGYAKCCVEYNLMDIHGALAPLILRLPGVYGQGDRQKSIVGRFIHQARAQEALTINGDGQQRREYLFIDDLKRLLKRMIDADLAGRWNLNPGQSTSIIGLVRMIEEALGRPVAVRYHPHQGESIQVQYAPSSVPKCFDGFAFTPLLDGIKIYLREDGHDA